MKGPSLLFGLNILVALTIGMVPPLLPFIAAAEWKLSVFEAGLINVAHGVGRLLRSFPASWILAHAGAPAALLLAFACGVSPTFVALLTARIVMGFGTSVTQLTILSGLLESAPRTR